MSDRLAKSFDRHLSVALGNDRAAKKRLLARGWKDFVNSDHPDTNNPAEMASHAVVYLGIHQNSWMKEPVLITAVLAFLREESGEAPMLDLKLLAASPNKRMDCNKL